MDLTMVELKMEISSKKNQKTQITLAKRLREILVKNRNFKLISNLSRFTYQKIYNYQGLKIC